MSTPNPQMPTAGDAKLKHLDFLQAAIARMASNSFLFKGWAITSAAGLSAFAATTSERALLAIAIITTATLWGLDGYYLWLERSFIGLYKEVAATDESDIDFSMQINKDDAFHLWLCACFRHHLLAFYGFIVLTEILGVVWLAGTK